MLRTLTTLGCFKSSPFVHYDYLQDLVALVYLACCWNTLVILLHIVKEIVLEC